MVTKIKRLYRSLVLTGTGLLSLILMAFNYLGLFATGDIREGLKDIGVLRHLRLNAYNFFELNGSFKIEGQKITLDMIRDISDEAAFAVVILKLLAFCLTIVLIASIILLIAGLISGVKDIFKKNLVIGVKPLLLDKISHIVMVVYGVAVAAAGFFSLIITIASMVLMADLASAMYVDGFACFGPRLGAILLLALAMYSMITIIIFDKRVFRVPVLTKTAYTCSACGVNHQTPSQFCPACGGTVGITQTQAPNPYYIDDAEVENFDYSLIPFYAKKLWTKIQNFLKEKNITKDQLIKGGAILVGAVIVLVLLISIINRPTPKYVMPDQYIDSIYDEENEETIFIIGGKKTDVKVEGMISDIQRSVDGNTIAFLDEEDTLYVIKKKKLLTVEEEISNFKLSVEGDGIAFVNVEDELMLYSVKKDSAKKITGDIYGEYVISPDGKSVAYTKGDDDGDYKLYVSVNGKEGKKIGNNLSPLGISNKGKLIYYINAEKLTVHVVKGDKEPQKLGSAGNFEAIAFNIDHTEAVFELNSGTYITKNGKEKVKITSNSIRQLGNYSDWGIVIDGYYSDSSTIPVKSFAKQYFTSNGSLYYLNKRFKAIEIEEADGIDSYQMTLTGDVIYYVDGNTLYRGTGKKANFKFKEVAEDVSSFEISSDGKFCYFKTYDNSLMCVKKTGKAKLIADDVNSFSMSHDDYLFFRVDGDLYVSHNRSKKKQVAPDVARLSFKVDATYYYVDDGDETVIYAAHKKAKFSKLIEFE